MRVVATRRDQSVLDLTIHEGKNRQVRRMLESLERPVLALVRMRFGPLSLGTLGVGETRPASEKELGELRKIVLAFARTRRRMSDLRPYLVRGIRGATSVESNEAATILAATEELLLEIRERNTLDLDLVASALFTVTPDLTAAFPAAAARRIGWQRVPLLNFTEIDVAGGLPRCIRVLIHVNTRAAQMKLFMSTFAKLTFFVPISSSRRHRQRRGSPT